MGVGVAGLYACSRNLSGAELREAHLVLQQRGDYPGGKFSPPGAGAQYSVHTELRGAGILCGGDDCHMFFQLSEGPLLL